MSGVSMCRVVGIVCREVGAWWLPAGGIRASQGTFSSYTFIGLGTLMHILDS